MAGKRSTRYSEIYSHNNNIEKIKKEKKELIHKKYRFDRKKRKIKL